MPLQTGQVLNNRYRIVKPIAQGGFGAVYRAWDLNLEGPRALKENLDLSPYAQQQFKLEAKILSQLSHPNLPHVVDHFILAGQGQYLVMDFVEGEDLEEMLDRLGSPLPEKQAVSWISQVCEAVAYLHSQTPPIIHRDIKPANIKITPQGVPVLVDFGLSKVYDPNQATTLGAKGVSPGYSPPEQYGQKKTDKRSDIYALGATLYNLLTGTPAPDSVDLLTESVPPPPPAASLNPAVSPTVSQAVGRAMEHDRDRRYQSAAEFKAALSGEQTLISTTPISAPAQPKTLDIDAQALVLTEEFTVEEFTPVEKQDGEGLWANRLLWASGLIILLLAAIFLLQLGGINPFTSADEEVTEAPPTATVVEITSTALPTEDVQGQAPVTDTQGQAPTGTTPPDPTATQVPRDTPEAITAPTQTQAVFDLQLCEVDPGEICIYSYGVSASNQQVVTLLFPAPPGFEIYLLLGGDEDRAGDEFSCTTLEDYPERVYCTGPKQPARQWLLLEVYRSEGQGLLASGEIYFLPPTPTPPPTAEDQVDCVGDECDDLELPTATP
jgi:serine/threonine-protein kinase